MVKCRAAAPPIMRLGGLVLLLLAASLSGCADGKDDPEDHDDGDGGHDETTTAGNQTAGTDPGLPGGTPGATSPFGPNVAPVANLTVDSSNGTAPLNVTFILDAQDANGDALTWGLDVDGDGTDDTNGTEGVLPLNFTYSFLTAGTYNATMHVSDGQAEGNATVMLTVGEAGPGVTQEVAATWVAGPFVVGCFMDTVLGDPNYPAQLDGIAYDSFVVDPATIGLHFTVSMDSDGVADSPGFTFLDAAGNIVYTKFGAQQEGTVPIGAAKGYFWVCAGGPMTGSYLAA
jgi:hypothetical protein